jgi:DNA polymerase-3 subunit epsilon
MIVFVLDTETSGLPVTTVINDTTISSWPYIVQFTYIMYDTETNTILKTSDNIINIPNTIVLSPANIAIHGITRNIMDASGRPIGDVLTEFLTDLEGVGVEILVAHNLEFDRNMIIAEIYRHNSNNANNANTNTSVINSQSVIKLRYMNSYCTMKRTLNLSTFKRTNPITGKEYVKYLKLSELYNILFNINPTNMHNALHDVIATLRCFIKLQNNIDIYLVNSTLHALISAQLHPAS